MAEIPRAFPQFGKSIWNVARPAWEVFGKQPGNSQCKPGGCGNKSSGCGCGGSCGGDCGGSCEACGTHGEYGTRDKPVRMSQCGPATHGQASVRVKRRRRRWIRTQQAHLAPVQSHNSLASITSISTAGRFGSGGGEPEGGGGGFGGSCSSEGCEPDECCVCSEAGSISRRGSSARDREECIAEPGCEWDKQCDPLGCPCMELYDLWVSCAAGTMGDPLYPCHEVAHWYYLCARDFPECPPLPYGLQIKKCGADVTLSMLAIMSVAWGKCLGSMNIRELANYMGRLQPGGELDWKLDSKKQPRWMCNVGCKHTLAICGLCFNDSTPANIMFGFITAACGGDPIAIGKKYGKKSLPFQPGLPPPPGAIKRSRIAKVFNDPYLYQWWEIPWPKHDESATQLGRDLATGPPSSARLCAAVKAKAASLQPPDKDPECAKAPACA